MTDEPYVVAMPLDSPRLLREINRALAALGVEGYWAGLQEKWFR